MELQPPLIGTISIDKGPDWLRGTHRCTLAREANGTVRELVATVEGPTVPGLLNAIAGDERTVAGAARGRLDSGVRFETHLQFVCGAHGEFAAGAAPKATVKVAIAAVTFGELPQCIPAASEWVFRVPFVPLTYGTSATHAGPADGTNARARGGWVLDSTPLLIGGRAWTLRVSGPTKADDSAEVAEIRTATECHSDLLEAQAALQPLLSLISLTCGRVMVWTSVELRTPSGVEWCHVPAKWCPRVATQGIAHLPANDPRAVQRFVEQAFPAISEDPLWWETTIALYLQPGLNPFVEMKLAVLTVLLERIAARIAERTPAGNLGAGFKEAIGSGTLETALDACMREQVAGWRPDQTRSIIGQLKRWDAGGSYSDSIRAACRTMDLPAPMTSDLKLRNALLHGFNHAVGSGELDDAWLRLDDLAMLLMLRLLNYDGAVFLAAERRETRLTDLHR